MWLWFEGVFRNSYIFLNGAQIFYHDCGYTSFAVRIDNASTVVKGGRNVLAIFVDPNTGPLSPKPASRSSRRALF